MEQARIYFIVEDLDGSPYVAGGALTENDAVIAADRLADNVVNTGGDAKGNDVRVRPPTDGGTARNKALRIQEVARFPAVPYYGIGVFAYH